MWWACPFDVSMVTEINESLVMDADDKKKLYEVNELQEYQDEVGFKSTVPQSGSNPGPNLWRILTPILLILLILVLLLSLILQSITVYQLLNDSKEENDGSSVTSAVTGVNNGVCNCSYSVNVSANTEVLKKLDLIMSKIEDITSFNDVQLMQVQNNTGVLEESFEATQQTLQTLIDIVRTLSTLKDNSITTEGVVNDVLLLVEKLQNSSQPMSCQDVKNSQPNSPSGYYHINGEIVYCEMGELCGLKGGWSRLAHLDMTDSTVDCPTGFMLYELSGVRACGRPDVGKGCQSVKFPSNGVSYSEVCGRVVGYQYGSADAVDTRFVTSAEHNDIDGYYVDGVSITHGYPRNHVWTFMIGNWGSLYSDGNCPCNTPPGGTQEIQSFIGSDYFCESGLSFDWPYLLYVNDPVWDGEECGSQEESCCSAAGLPWFHKTLNSTTDYLELRVCADQTASNEDAPVSFYEIYVK